jgi:O-antigen ligase
MVEEKIIANKKVQIAVIFSSFFIIPFLYSSKLIDPVLSISFFGLSVLSLISFMVLLYLNFRKKIYFDIRLLNNGIVFSFFLFLMICGFSILKAYNKHEAFSEFIKLLQYFIFFIVLLFVLNKATLIDLFSKVVITFSALILLLGIIQFYQVFEKGAMNHQATYLIKATFAHRNLYCEMLLLCFPFTLFGIYNYKKTWKILSVISAILILIFVTTLLSRAAWLAIVISSFCTWIVFFLFNKETIYNKRILRKVLIYSFFVFAIISSAVFIYSRLDNITTFKKQINGFTNHTYGSSQERLVLWKKSIEITNNNYFLGRGLGNWKIIMPSVGVENMRSETGELIFQRPHNDLIWVFSESGFSGLLLYLLIFIFSIIFIFKMLKNSNNKAESFFILMLFYCLVIFSVISLFSFPKERITQSMFIIYILAIIVVLFKNKTVQSVYNKWLNPVFIVIILLNVFIVNVAFSRMISEYHLNKAIKYKTREDFQQTIQEIDKVDTDYYTLDPTATPINWYSGVAYYRLNEFNNAKEEFLKAYQNNPYHIKTLNNLATCYVKNNELNLAEQFYNKALEISPKFEDALKNLSVVYYKQGKYKESYSSLSECKIQFDDPKYSLLVYTLMPIVITDLTSKIDDEFIVSELNEIKKSEKWMKDIHMKHIKENRSIENQLLLDAIYELEITQKLISASKAKEWKIKYHLMENRFV